MNTHQTVTPVKTGVQDNYICPILLDSGFRRNDENVHNLTFFETVRGWYASAGPDRIGKG